MFYTDPDDNLKNRCYSKKILGHAVFHLLLESTLSLEHSLLLNTLSFFYKQLGSSLNPQSCSCFQGFRGSKLLNGYLVVSPSNLSLQGMQ